MSGGNSHIIIYMTGIRTEIFKMVEKHAVQF